MRFVLFGAGELGERYYNRLKDVYDIVCFSDNDTRKHGQKLLSLDIVNPNMIAELGLSVIISSKLQYRLEIIKQLFSMGIKEFYVLNDSESSEISKIDLTPYDDLSEVHNIICVFRNTYGGANAAVLIKNNPFKDIEIVSVNRYKQDSEYYYYLFTSRLVITFFAENTSAWNKISISVYHGFPIKAMGKLNQSPHYKNRVEDIVHSYVSQSTFCSLSKLYSILMGYCYGIDYGDFNITGYPRNDMLLESDGHDLLKRIFGASKQVHTVIYMPTFRESTVYANYVNGENAFIPNMPGFDENDFDDYLRRNNILFLHKMHTWQNERETFKETTNIRRITDDMLYDLNLDLYELLNGTDCLISDYSSIIIDYLLIDKPIIFTPTDLDAYADNRGLMLDPYDAWMPGEIALDYEQLKNALTNALFGKDKYKKDRERLKQITHKYTDAKSSERVLTLAREMMGI